MLIPQPTVGTQGTRAASPGLAFWVTPPQICASPTAGVNGTSPVTALPPNEGSEMGRGREKGKGKKLENPGGCKICMKHKVSRHRGRGTFAPSQLQT